METQQNDRSRQTDPATEDQQQQQQQPAQQQVVNLDNDKETKEDMRDNESLMDFGSGSGGGSAGDGAAA